MTSVKLSYRTNERTQSVSQSVSQSVTHAHMPYKTMNESINECMGQTYGRMDGLWCSITKKSKWLGDWTACAYLICLMWIKTRFWCWTSGFICCHFPILFKHKVVSLVFHFKLFVIRTKQTYSAGQSQSWWRWVSTHCATRVMMLMTYTYLLYCYLHCASTCLQAKKNLKQVFAFGR